MLRYLKTRPVFFALVFIPVMIALYNLMQIQGAVANTVNTYFAIGTDLFMIVVLSVYAFRIKRERWVPVICALAHVAHLIILFSYLYLVFQVQMNGESINRGRDALYISALTWLNASDIDDFVTNAARLSSLIQRVLGALYLIILGFTLCYFIVPPPPRRDREPGFGKFPRAHLRVVRRQGSDSN